MEERDMCHAGGCDVGGLMNASRFRSPDPWHGSSFCCTCININIGPRMYVSCIKQNVL